jgi:hypothetical protein
MNSDNDGGTVPCFLCKAFIYYESEKAEELSGHMMREHSVFFGLDFLLAACVMNEDERVAIVNVVKDRQPTKPGGSQQIVPTPSQPTKSGSKTDDDITIEDFGLDDDLPISALTPETTLQEENEVEDVTDSGDLSVSPPSIKDHKEDPVFYHHCDQCNQSFKLKIQLNRHMRSHETDGTDSGEPPSKKFREDKEVDQEEVMRKMKEKYQKLKKDKENRLLDICQSLQPERPSTPCQQRPSKGGPKANVTGNGSAEIAAPGTNPGSGNFCPMCAKEFKSNGPMRRHFEDIHLPGEFPCPGCQRIFSSRNKVSSHFSRNCKQRRRETIG